MLVTVFLNMLPLCTLVAVICALMASRKRAKDCIELRELVYKRRPGKKRQKKIRKRIENILSRNGLLLEFAGYYAYYPEICRTAIMQNPHALRFVPCKWHYSKNLLRKMTKLAWKVANERGIDPTPLLDYSTNVLLAFSFVERVVKSGKGDTICVPEWFILSKKGQMVLAKHYPQALPRDACREAVLCAFLSHPYDLPTELVDSGNVDQLIELIKHKGVDVLTQFINWTTVNGCEKEDFAAERQMHVWYFLDDYEDDHRRVFPFNNKTVFEAVFGLNMWTGLNYFDEDLCEHVFNKFLDVSPREALYYYEVDTWGDADKYVAWKKAFTKDRSIMLDIDTSELAKFFVWERLGTDLHDKILEYLGYHWY